MGRRTNKLTRTAVVLAALAFAALNGTGGAGAAPGSPTGKTIICHATASNTNPWVRIEVNNNALPAHFGQVGNSHSHQRSLGRNDFVWTEQYDGECNLLPVALPLYAECEVDPAGNVLDVVAYDEVNGVPVTTVVDCTVAHDFVPLPIGTVQLVCSRGTATTPAWTAFKLSPTSRVYNVTCVEGEVVHLGIEGGRFQAVCPAEGQLSLYRYSILTGAVVPVAMTCTPGSMFPDGTPVLTYTDSIDWNTAHPSAVVGLVKCPAAGALQLYFLGEGAPTAAISAATPVACTPGAPVDVTRLVLSA